MSGEKKYIPMIVFANRRDKSIGRASEEIAQKEYENLYKNKAYNASQDAIMIIDKETL